MPELTGCFCSSRNLARPAILVWKIKHSLHRNLKQKRNTLDHHHWKGSDFILFILKPNSKLSPMCNAYTACAEDKLNGLYYFQKAPSVFISEPCNFKSIEVNSSMAFHSRAFPLSHLASILLFGQLAFSSCQLSWSPHQSLSQKSHSLSLSLFCWRWLDGIKSRTLKRRKLKLWMHFNNVE